MTSPISDKVYKGIQILLFTFLFVYILFRVLYTETLHDEVATFIFYFYQGDYIGENIVWDANNHLLNSFVGHQLYKVFGDNMVILRLPNLLSFIVFFWGVVRLLKPFKSTALKLAGLFALTTIPFITEYFGNARGYGISMAFFIWAIVFLFDYFKAYSNRSLFLGYLSLGIAVSANLTLLITSLMLFALAMVAPLLKKQSRTSKQARIAWLYHCIFLVGITPFILFGFALKHANALYYGSLEGIWDVTGKTLSRFVLFIDFDWLQIVYLAVFALFGFLVYKIIRKIPFSTWLAQDSFVVALIFYGNLAAILLMAFVLKVNYPEDRAGMHLVILFILLVLFLLNHYKFNQWVLLAFAFFPISFVAHMSIETSVFSPDDRLNHKFYEAVKDELSPEKSLMIYNIMNWNWPYAESHSDIKASVGLFDNPNSTLVDVLVTKTTVLDNPEIFELYDTIAYHPASTYIAFKRKQPMEKILLQSSTVLNEASDQEYVTVADNIPLNYGDQPDLQLSISGHLLTYQPRNKIWLIVQTVNELGETERYLYYTFETTYQGQLIDDDFLHHFVLENVSPAEKEIKVYLWNRSFHALELTNAQCKIFELKSPENESR
ncbi:MAG: hypothetical protein QNK23_01165 [Crocinitomicaceae bacterium]|nr:hypothetical protein [Crocinitomicaceae bacterium]